MGLDFVEIVLDTEKTFGVELSEEDIEQLPREGDITVGDLYSLVLKKLHLRDVGRHDVRLNYHLWEGIRRVIESVTNVPLERIQLKTPLETLFPRETRRATWEALRRASPYRIPTLDYPKVVRRLGLTLAAAVVLIEQLGIWPIAGPKWLWPVLGILGIWMVSETYLKVLWICAPLRTSFPSRMTTVKDLCRTVLGANYEDVCRDLEIPMDDRCLAVWSQLTRMLAEQLGVDADTITFRSRLFRDLGTS